MVQRGPRALPLALRGRPGLVKSHGAARNTPYPNNRHRSPTAGPGAPCTGQVAGDPRVAPRWCESGAKWLCAAPGPSHAAAGAARASRGPTARPTAFSGLRAYPHHPAAQPRAPGHHRVFPGLPKVPDDAKGVPNGPAQPWKAPRGLPGPAGCSAATLRSPRAARTTVAWSCSRPFPRKLGR